MSLERRKVIHAIRRASDAPVTAIGVCQRFGGCTADGAYHRMLIRVTDEPDYLIKAVHGACARCGRFLRRAQGGPL